MSAEVAAVIEEHRASGREFEAAGVRSFALDSGSGEAVVLVHGVPSSSYLYRKVVPPLAERGHRAIAFDFPGLGLAERPEQFDYSWSGLAQWMGEALAALEVDRCHLVVHDIGGPIALEWAIRNPERVSTLTVMNTLLNVATFSRPWSMQPFAIRGLGEVWLKSLTRFSMRQILYLQAIADRKAVPAAEASAYHDLVKREDGGRAFLKIMRGFELTQEREDFFRRGLSHRHWPAQVVWGERDPALGESELEFAMDLLGLEHAVMLPAKHFPQEDHAGQVTEAIAAQADQAR
jgi:haloalkane dehalogenase